MCSSMGRRMIPNLNTKVMDKREFFDKVSEMRKAQKEYFSTRSSASLNRSKALEKEIDNEIARVNRILSGRKEPVQTELFGG